MILLDLWFSSKTFWASFLLSNLTIILLVSPNLWQATMSIASEWRVLREGQFWYCFGRLQFRCIHNASIVQVCEYLSPLQLFCRLVFLWFMESVIEVFSTIITLLWRVSFSFFRSSNLASIASFYQNSLLSLISSVCFDIRLSCSCIRKSISYFFSNWWAAYRLCCCIDCWILFYWFFKAVVLTNIFRKKVYSQNGFVSTLTTLSNVHTWTLIKLRKIVAK